MNILINWIISTIAVLATAYLLPGIHIDNYTTAFIVALVLGIANAIIRPILLILTLPVTILTLGLFALVINALMVLLTSSIVKGFYVENFLWALLFSIVLSIISSLFQKIFK